MKKLISALALIFTITFLPSSCGGKESHVKSETDKTNVPKDTIIIGQIRQIYYKFVNKHEQYMLITLYNDTLNFYNFICQIPSNWNDPGVLNSNLILNAETKDIFTLPWDNTDRYKMWHPNPKYLDAQVKLTCTRSTVGFKGYDIINMTVISFDDKKHQEQECEGYITTGIVKGNIAGVSGKGFLFKKKDGDANSVFFKLKDIDNPNFSSSVSGYDYRFDDGLAYGGVRENLFDDQGELMPSHKEQLMRITYNYYTSCIVNDNSSQGGAISYLTFKADAVSLIKAVQ